MTLLVVNGARVEVQAEPGENLLWVLREKLGLTGAKYGCGEGQCGACTVLVEGRPRRSCITPLSQVEDRKIVTIEGLAKEDALHPVQQAFLEADALQCGYCTPGMILSALALLESNPNPGDEDILDAMEGNICRCGTYPRIKAAIQKAGANMGGAVE